MGGGSLPVPAQAQDISHLLGVACAAFPQAYKAKTIHGWRWVVGGVLSPKPKVGHVVYHRAAVQHFHHFVIGLQLPTPPPSKSLRQSHINPWDCLLLTTTWDQGVGTHAPP